MKYKCKEEKNVCNFGNSKLSKDGLLYCCKECNNKRSVSYRKNNPEKVDLESFHRNRSVFKGLLPDFITALEILKDIIDEITEE
jgi:hypothetical protein